MYIKGKKKGMLTFPPTFTPSSVATRCAKEIAATLLGYQKKKVHNDSHL